jgi:N-methylhydantoinase A
VRRYALVAFGGAGPLHACALADELGVAKAIVPPAPGALAALGLLVASRRADASLSKPMPAERPRDGELRSILHELTEQVLAELATEGIVFADTEIQLAVDCRYRGQSHELRIGVAGGPSFARVAEAFHAAHRDRYGFEQRNVPVEAVTFRAAALGPSEEIVVGESTAQGTEPVASRNIGGRECPVYERRAVGRGSAIDGPALVVELDSTTWIEDGWTALVHESGALVLERL